MVKKYSKEKGRIGVAFVAAALTMLGVEFRVMGEDWHYDISTKQLGWRIEVKFANLNFHKSKGRKGEWRFQTKLSDQEYKVCDFVILVLNVSEFFKSFDPQENNMVPFSPFFFYIIPKEELTSPSISFNPFSRQKSQYDRFLGRWDLLLSKKQQLNVSLAQRTDFCILYDVLGSVIRIYSKREKELRALFQKKEGMNYLSSVKTGWGLEF